MTDAAKEDKSELDKLTSNNLPVPVEPEQDWDYVSAVKRTRKK